MRQRAVRSAGAGVAALVVLGVAGCAQGSAQTTTTSAAATSAGAGGQAGGPSPSSPALAPGGRVEASLPSGTPQQPPQPPLYAATADGRLWLVTWGSGSCPIVPVTVAAAGAQAVTVTVDRNDGPCTADLRPTATSVPLAGLADAAKEVTVTVQGAGLTGSVVARPA